MERRFRDFVADQAFPCVGAKSALARGGMEIVIARDITSAWDDVRICEVLLDFAARPERSIARIARRTHSRTFSRGSPTLPRSGARAADHRGAAPAGKRAIALTSSRSPGAASAVTPTQVNGKDAPGRNRSLTARNSGQCVAKSTW